MPPVFAITFDWSINLGNVLTALALFAGLWHASLRLTRRATIFESKVQEHTTALEAHSSRMEKQDTLLFKLVGDVQRLVGRLETLSDRRVAPRGIDP